MPQGKVLSFVAIAVAAMLAFILLANILSTFLPLLLTIALGFGTWLMFSYNKLQALAQNIHEAHSNTMVSMKKRVDLANKLIDIASSYGDKEQLTQITIAQNESVQGAIVASQQVDGAVNRIISMSRAYPELRANQTYQLLMEQLGEIESDLQVKRESYNASVKKYNTKCTEVPLVFLAPQLGFKTAPYFDVENADALQNIKDFHSHDGEAIKAMFSQAGQKVINTSKTISAEISQASQNALNKSKQQAEDEPEE
ncbi:MAG: LemA family protein [Calothrix sp. FI2-JRJ7]|jgi:LemA protein|nr:LemA family protein [Calothrix sp. FI2-JRJ7]